MSASLKTDAPVSLESLLQGAVEAEDKQSDLSASILSVPESTHSSDSNGTVLV